MPRLSIIYGDETFECAHCGLDSPESTEVYLDGKPFLLLDTHAECSGDAKWHKAELLHAILTKLGYSFEYF